MLNLELFNRYSHMSSLMCLVAVQTSNNSYLSTIYFNFFATLKSNSSIRFVCVLERKNHTTANH